MYLSPCFHDEWRGLPFRSSRNKAASYYSLLTYLCDTIYSKHNTLYNSVARDFVRMVFRGRTLVPQRLRVRGITCCPNYISYRQIPWGKGSKVLYCEEIYLNRRSLYHIDIVMALDISYNMVKAILKACY